MNKSNLQTKSTKELMKLKFTSQPDHQMGIDKKQQIAVLNVRQAFKQEAKYHLQRGKFQTPTNIKEALC